MDNKLFEILACPFCKGDLKIIKKTDELICRPCGLAFPIRDGIPIMLENKARTLNLDERTEKGTVR